MIRKRGSFSLIELLVVISFILLFSGISIGYYTQYTERTKLENAGKRIMAMLSLVRQKTVSGDSSMCAPQPATTPPAAVSFYTFAVNNDAASYTVRPYCSIGTAQPLNYNNEPNILFLTPVPPTPYPVITFFPVNGGSVCNYIYFQNRTLSPSQRCRYVKVNQSGSLEEGVCSSCNTCPTCP